MKIATIAVATVWAVAGGTAWGQNWAEPVYQGMQPSLIRGVDDGIATGRPKIRHVYLAAPDVLAIVVDAQNVWSKPLVKYEKQPGDVIRHTRPQRYGLAGHAFYWGRDLFRNGQFVGEMVGLKEDYVAPRFEHRGEPLDIAWAEKPDSYGVTSDDDANFREPTAPTAVFRKSKPEAYQWVADGEQKGSSRHELYLRLPRPLKAGSAYTVIWRGAAPFDKPVTFAFDDTRLRTEAVQVNQLGYHPRQAEKIARVSMWLGSGGGVDFKSLKDFRVLNDATGENVFEGRVTLRRAGKPGKEMPPERTEEPTDDLPADVYQLDFSAFERPGVYRIVVPGLGCSFPFRIDENVWRDAVLVSANGLFNQRSGIALGPPYSAFKRPRDIHPADGVPVYKTDPARYFNPGPTLAKINPTTAPATQPSAFNRIQASILEDQTEPNAWGGWHDAADYDRDILPQNHMKTVHDLLDLYDANPAYFERLNLNLPESNNAIPDVVDEAIWGMAIWLRLQQPDGGVASAIESIEHPSEPSWMLGQPTAVTPPMPATCELWAAAAAQLSIVLEKYDAPQAKVYRDSALRAMKWADAHADVPNVFGRGNRAAAALWLYRLTGDASWQDQFKTAIASKPIELTVAKAYALMPDKLSDPALRQKCRDIVLKAADDKVRRTSDWTWNLGPQRFNWAERLGQSSELVVAHRLTGDSKYLQAMERLAQFALGLNPTNASYTTGLGTRQVAPFNLEARYLGSAYPHGITTYGPGPRNIWRGASIEKTLSKAGLYPEWKNWPWAESSFNIFIANLNEYTVTDLSSHLLTRGYLAQNYAAATH